MAQASPKYNPQQPNLNPHDLFRGRGTWYYPGLGACGSVAKTSDFIVSVSHLQFHHEICYKEVVLVNPTNHKWTRAQIQDMCPGCGFGSVDMSPAVFSTLAETGLEQGVVQVKWSFADVQSKISSPRSLHWARYSDSDNDNVDQRKESPSTTTSSLFIASLTNKKRLGGLQRVKSTSFDFTLDAIRSGRTYANGNNRPITPPPKGARRRVIAGNPKKYTGTDSAAPLGLHYIELITQRLAQAITLSMGTSSNAILARGFVLPNDKLFRLLQIFRCDHNGEADADDHDEYKNPSKSKTHKQTLEDMDELHGMIVEALESSGLEEWFTLRFCHGGEPLRVCSNRLEPIFMLHYSESGRVGRWGSDNYGATGISLGEDIVDDISQEERDTVVKLQKVLHLDEADIKLKEEWLLIVSIQ
ncbi:hypothetical protein BU17DRAFT_79160 [Hysterangium stoloniferum]|nr:hypothetical protein BU17DRAFT_79160 [Hysterangium stoloniferum]